MISIIIPYYFAREECIQRALESCGPGVELGAEVIIVFDSEFDGTAERVKARTVEQAGERYPAVTFVENAENLGPARSRRAGLRHAKQPFVILLDQDDELTEARFALNERETSDMILYETLCKSAESQVHEAHPPRHKRINALPSRTLNQIIATRRQPARLGALTIRRELADRFLSGEDGGGEEWEFFVSLLSKRLTIEYRDTIGLVRHAHDANLSVVKREERLEHWRSRVDRAPVPWIVRFVANRTVIQRAAALAQPNS